MNNLSETACKMSQIIEIQSSIIDDLFMAVLQLESADAVDKQIYDKMKEAADIKEGLERCRQES